MVLGFLDGVGWKMKLRQNSTRVYAGPIETASYQGLN